MMNSTPFDDTVAFSHISSRKTNHQQDSTTEQQRPPSGSDEKLPTSTTSIRAPQKRLTRAFMSIAPTKRPSSLINLQGRESAKGLSQSSITAQSKCSLRTAKDKTVSYVSSIAEVNESKNIGSPPPKNIVPTRSSKIEEILSILRVRQAGVNLYQKELTTLLALTSQLRCFNFMYDHPNSKQYRLPLKCIQLMKYECFQPGQTIFKIGDEPDRFYLLLKGNVNVFNSKPQQVIESEKNWLKFLDKMPQKQQLGSRGILSNLLKGAPALGQIAQQSRELRLDIAAQMHFEFQNQKAQEIVEQTNNYQSQKIKRSLFKVGIDDDTSVESASADLDLESNKSEPDKSVTSDHRDQSENSSGSSESEEEEGASIRSKRKASEFDETAPMFVKMLGGIDLKTTEDIKQYFEDDVFTLIYERTLTSGSLIGELGLLSQKPRARTLINKDVSELVSFSREGYYGLVSLISESKVTENFELIRKSLFPDVTAKLHLRLLSIMKLKKFRRGQPIYSIGDPGDMIFLIKEGEVALEREIKQDLVDPRIFDEKDLLPDLKKQGTHRTFRRAFKKSTKENDLTHFAREMPGALHQLKKRMKQKNRWRSDQIEKVEATKELIKNQANNSTSQQLNSSREQSEISPEKNKSRFSPGPKSPEAARTERKGKSMPNSPEKPNPAKSEKSLTLVKKGGSGLNALLRAKRADRDPKTWGIFNPTDIDHVRQVAQSNEKLLKQRLRLTEESQFFDQQGVPIVSAFASKALQRRIAARRKERSPQEKIDRSISLSKMTDSQIVEYYMMKKNIQKSPNRFFKTAVPDKADAQVHEAPVHPTKKLLDRLKTIGNSSYLALNRRLKEKSLEATPRDSTERKMAISSREASPSNSFLIQSKINLTNREESKRFEPARSGLGLLSSEIKRRPLSMKSSLNRTASAVKPKKPQLNSSQHHRVITPNNRGNSSAFPTPARNKTPVRMSSESHRSIRISHQ